MVHIRLVHMSSSHMTLAPRLWRRWQRLRQYLTRSNVAQRLHQRRPVRREIGVPIGGRWELQFYWYE